MREYCKHLFKTYCLNIVACRWTINLSLSFKMEFWIGHFICNRNENNIFSLLVTPVGPIAIRMFDCSHAQPNSNNTFLEITYLLFIYLFKILKTFAKMLHTN